MIYLAHKFVARGACRRAPSIIVYFGFILLVFSAGFSYILLATGGVQRYLQHADNPSLKLLSTNIRGVNFDNWPDINPHRSGTLIYAHLLKPSLTVETDPSSDLATNCPRVDVQGSGFKRKNQRILCKRSQGALNGVTLDTTFESVANFVWKSTQTREETWPKSLPQFQSPVLRSSKSDLDSDHLGHLARGDSPEEVYRNSRPEAGQLTSKIPHWERLGGHIDQTKWEHYRQHLRDLKGASLVLHMGNKEQWKEEKFYRADEEEMKAFFEYMKPSFKLRALFELYNFLIDRSLSDKEIWWSQADYTELQKKCEYQSDDIHLTIQIGDFFHPHLSKKEAGLSPQEMDEVRNKFFELFKTFKQSEKSYDRKWTTGAGRTWLNERFSRITDDETRYSNLMKHLGAEAEPGEWKKSTEKLVQNLDVKGWAPPSLKFTWLDHGFDVDKMEELICMVEAYKTSHVEAAYNIAKASQSVEEKKLSLLPLAYSNENMIKRFLELNRSLSYQSKERRLMLKWISENLYSHQQIEESMLNVGKYTANTGYDRVRFNILLTTHKIHEHFMSWARACLSWIRDLFGPNKIGVIFKYFRPKK